MSRPPLSDAQSAAVHCAFADALVNAGAGSGKTRVLSERFVHLVREGQVELRRLASLTFTEKAAAQMRQRIGDLFRELEGDAEGEAAAQLGAWRADVEFAPISTIHAFCALLLRQHAVEAGVDPSFEVLDAVEAALLEDDAARRAEQYLAAEEPELVQVLATIGGDAREHVLSLLRKLRGAGTAIDALAWRHGDEDLDAALDEVETQWPLLLEGRDCLEEERHRQFDEMIARVQEVVAQVRADPDASPFRASQAHAAVGRLTGPRKHAYSKPRKALDLALGALVGGLLDRWGERVLLPRLKQALHAYADAYEALKHERSALDFTDLELRARDLLAWAQERGEPLDLAPRGLLVDEYQDTNPLQAELLGDLRRTGTAQARTARSGGGVPQFAVGDPKQSIYRFRRADVGVILEEAKHVGEDAVHPMHASYRSCPPLVAAVNALNERLFLHGAAGVDYDPLEARGAFLPAGDPVLEFALFDRPKKALKDVSQKAEAAWIAQRIHELVVAGTPRLAPKRRADGTPTTEPVGRMRYGDVALLFRASTDIPVYEKALEARGIPFLTQKSKGYFQSQEMVDLVYVLRAIHNPDDRFALACMATGPAMGATDDELLRWFHRDPSGQDRRTPWERIVAEARAGGRHAETVGTLTSLRVAAAGGALAHAVERALVELGLYECALLSSGGDRAAANLRKAVQVARQLDEGGRRGLDDLLGHLASMRDRETGESEAAIGGEADNVVRLTTIHGAKGLEYPVVFVPDVGRQVMVNSDRIQFDGKLDIAVRVADPLEGSSCTPGGHKAIQEAEKRADAQEALRVLYVAMTRAEERLVLSGLCEGLTKEGHPARLYGWGRQLWDALDTGFEHGVKDVALPSQGDPAVVRVQILDAEAVPLLAAREAVTEIPPVAGDALAQAATLLEAAAEPVAPLADTRFVVSVSELLAFAASPQRYYRERVIQAGASEALAAAWDAPTHEVEAASPDDLAGARAERVADWDEAPEPPSGAEGAGARSAGPDRAALGRAVHAVLEHVRATDTSAPSQYVERAVEAEGGDETFAAAVRAMVERFLASPLGERLREALAEGRDVRREVALHARIRFPGGEPVGGFDSLLVKGSIDLWLPTAEGVLVVDHKTNRKGGAFDTPASLAEHYAWQLRLYALATERALGADVAGTALMLLDPSWGDEALEVPVDVSGDALEETRRLCRAFAIAELEGRYPEDWRALLR